jgi:hypothetical protein
LEKARFLDTKKAILALTAKQQKPGASQDFVDKQRFFVYCTLPNPELIHKWGAFPYVCCFLSHGDKPGGTRRGSGTKND